MIEATLVQLADPVLAGGLHPQTAPQGMATPYGIYELIVAVPQNTLADGVTAEQNIFQIDVFGSTYLVAKAAGEALDAAIQGAFEAGTLTGICRSRRSRYEAEVKLHRFIYEYSLWS